MPPPTSATPTQGGSLQSLLARFGSRASAESATRSRRLLSHVTTSTSVHSVDPDDTADSFVKGGSSDLDDPFFDAPESQPPQPISVKSSSEDELVRPVRPSRTRSYNKTPSSARSGRTMADSKSRTGTGSKKRRSTRNILESDQFVELPYSPKRARAPKLDTARSRLREGIARQSRAKADNFLIANQEYFLPLLPANNYITKLAANHPAKPITEYKQLEQQPEGVRATLKPYQLSGLSYLVYLNNNGFSGILGDEMGLGKTLQTLSLFQYLEEQDVKNNVTSEELRPYLVICPLSVLNSWATEAERWVPDLRVLRIHGAKSQRDHLKKVALGLEDLQGHETLKAQDRKTSRKAGIKTSSYGQGASSYKIIITTYETFQSEHHWFRHSFLWRYVVLDEGHKIKNNTSNVSHSLKNISSEFRLILTGTPLQNNLVEMWSLLAWLYPNVFTDNTEPLFKESFDLTRGKINRQTMDDARSLLELIMLRRMKDSPNVNLGLPPKTEILLYVPLTPMQRFWYTRLLTRADNAMLEDVFANGKEKEQNSLQQDKADKELLRNVEKLENVDSMPASEWDEMAEIMREAIKKEEATSTNKSAWQKLMNLVMQLRKCCSHPYLLPDVAPDPYYLSDHIIRASGKFIVLEKLLRHTILEQGKKVLIFSSFTRTLDCCEDLLTLVSDYGTKFHHLRLDGSSPRAFRNLDIRLFNQEPEYKVMLLSTRAGGLGINLTSAQDIIFLDDDWNPQITLQAEARAHRIGQTKPVTIYKLCTQGTVEEQMMGRIRKKLYLSAKITESMRNIHGDDVPAKANTDDMPHMDTTQLKTLIRRGAQTLSHPDIDVTEMLSWDLETMLEKCRDKGVEAEPSEGDEEKWLSVMERVECAVFDGKHFHRQAENAAKEAAKNILPSEITRDHRREGKNTTVMVNGFAVNKESMQCGDWEAVPTFAGKDPRLAEPVREKRRGIAHEEHCLACFKGPKVKAGEMLPCKTCPRSYHFDCLEPEYQVKVRGVAGFHCPQHRCASCDKSTADAGGLIYRCRWCPDGFCEDCLDWDNTKLVGRNLPEFELLGEPEPTGAFYIKCLGCLGKAKKQKQALEKREAEYKKQYDIMLQERNEIQAQPDTDDVPNTKPEITDSKPEIIHVKPSLGPDTNNAPEVITSSSSFASPTSAASLDARRESIAKLKTREHALKYQLSRMSETLSPTPSVADDTEYITLISDDSSSDKLATKPLPTPTTGASRVNTPKETPEPIQGTRRKRQSIGVRGGSQRKTRRTG